MMDISLHSLGLLSLRLLRRHYRISENDKYFDGWVVLKF